MMARNMAEIQNGV